MCVKAQDPREGERRTENVKLGKGKKSIEQWTGNWERSTLVRTSISNHTFGIAALGVVDKSRYTPTNFELVGRLNFSFKFAKSF